jgi:ubiquitin-protein ligase
MDLDADDAVEAGVETVDLNVDDDDAAAAGKEGAAAAIEDVVDLDAGQTASGRRQRRKRRRGNDGAVAKGDAHGDDGDLEIVGVVVQRPAGDADVIVVGARASPVLDLAAPAPATMSTCDACKKAFGAGVSPLVASRCKHALCEACAVQAVAEVSNEVSGTGGEKALQAREIKALPTCPARRCRAPMSAAEARAALVPPAVDGMFADALEDFDEWLACGATELATVPVTLPPFSEEMATLALRVEGSDALGEWFTDDLLGAYAPLWLYEGDEAAEAANSGEGGIGVDGVVDDDDDDVVDLGGDAVAPVKAREATRTVLWVCAACGLPTDAPASDTSSPPLFLHCANARAFGLLQSIDGLVEVTRSAEQVLAATDVAAKPAAKRKAARAFGTKTPVYRSYKHRQPKGFAKGTGYGGDQSRGSEWQGLSKTFLEQTARADAAAAYWFSRIRAFLLVGMCSPLSSWPGFIRALLRRSRVTDHIATVIGNESIMDVGARVLVYVAAIRVVMALIEIPSLRVLVTESNNVSRGRSIVSLVLAMSRQAALLAMGVGLENLDGNMLLLCRQIRRCVRAIKRHDLEPKDGPGSQPKGVESNAPLEVDSLDIDIMMDCQANGGAGGCPTTGGEGPGCIPDPTDLVTPVTEAERTAYADAMRDLQFETVSGLAELSSFRAEATKVLATGGGRADMMRRVATEVASLSSSLPLYWSSTIVLRVDEDRYDFLQAMITGPDGSPYSCGCFIFDIYLPPTYPNTPPKFKLLTTGGGRVRFNPNLYACGKVCLSLLGTWTGPSWTQASTLLQVLVSIQSLILVEDPYFNEPGYEASINTPHGRSQSAAYNKRVRRDTVVAAMLANIRHPPPHVERAVREHFRLKRRAVKVQMGVWFPSVKPASASTSTSSTSATSTVAAAKKSAAAAALGAATAAFSSGYGMAGAHVAALQQQLATATQEYAAAVGVGGGYGSRPVSGLTPGELSALFTALDAL